MHGRDVWSSEVTSAVKERETFLLAFGDSVRDLADSVEIQAVASRLLGQHLAVNRVAYAEMTERDVTVACDYVDGVQSIAGRYPTEIWGKSHLEAWRHRDVVTVNDVFADPELPEQARASWRAIEVASYIAVTLEKEGKTVAALGVHSATPRRWTTSEIELVKEVADRTWAAIRRALAEAALRESEHRYAAIFEKSPFAIALVRTADDTIIEANPAFLRLLELAPGEMIGRSGSLLGVVDPESQARLRHELGVHGSVRDFSITLRTKSGATRMGSLTLDRVTVGREPHLLATFRDLTDLRRAEEAARLYEERANAEAALRRSEAMSAGILETSMDAIISIDEQHRITLFNRGAEQIFGYTRAEVLGEPLELLLPENAHAVHRQHVAKLAAGDESSRCIAIWGRRKNGEEFPAEISISKLVVDGTTILTAQGRDITERRRIEREQHFLAELGDALSSLDYQAALDKFAQLAATSLADFATVFVLRNEGMFSCAAAAAKDPAHAWCVETIVDQPTSPRARHPMWRAIETRSPVVVPLEPEAYEAIAQSPEHLRGLQAVSPRHVLFVPMIVLDQVVGVLGLGSSSRPFGAAELHLAQEAARRCALFIENARLYRAAQQAIRGRDDMLGVVAHDLRSPLNTIILHAQLLATSGAQPHGQAEISGNVIRRVGRGMTRIIEDLLELTRAEAGRLTIEPARLSVHTLVDDAVLALRDQVIARSLALRVDVPADLPEVRGDRGRVLQVFENLVGNAMKFTTDGRITIGARGGDGEVQLWVADTGRGIPQDQLGHVFDRFWQARGTTRRSGTGLGLAIVKGIVEAHGGQVWVESAVDVGSTFFFSLPVAKGRRERSSNKVLVAEDDPDTREALVMLLRLRGFEVDAVADGAMALAHLHASPPSLLILDLAMPVMDGWAVLAERAREPALQEIPVIVASGQPEVAERLVLARAHFLSKPVSPDLLLSMIEGAIG